MWQSRKEDLSWESDRVWNQLQPLQLHGPEKPTISLKPVFLFLWE